MATKEKSLADELHEKHAELIKAYEEESDAAKVASEMGDKKAAESHNARKSNRSREIRAVELEMATEGVKFEPWAKPKSARNGTTKPPVSEDQLKSDLEKIGKVFNGKFPESTKDTARKRIEGLLKQAEKLGYDVTDPRTSE